MTLSDPIPFCRSAVRGRIREYGFGGMNNETISRNGHQGPQEGEGAKSPRRPYLSPRILERQPIEAVAAVCTVPGGKNDPTCLVGFS